MRVDVEYKPDTQVRHIEQIANILKGKFIDKDQFRVQFEVDGLVSDDCLKEVEEHKQVYCCKRIFEPSGKDWSAPPETCPRCSAPKEALVEIGEWYVSGSEFEEGVEDTLIEWQCMACEGAPFFM